MSAPTCWMLTWQDEFDGPSGTRPNPAKWIYDLGGEPEWGNEEWQYYTNQTQTSSSILKAIAKMEIQHFDSASTRGPPAG